MAWDWNQIKHEIIDKNRVQNVREHKIKGKKVVFCLRLSYKRFLSGLKFTP